MHSPTLIFSRLTKYIPVICRVTTALALHGMHVNVYRASFTGQPGIETSQCTVQEMCIETPSQASLGLRLVNVQYRKCV